MFRRRSLAGYVRTFLEGLVAFAALGGTQLQASVSDVSGLLLLKAVTFLQISDNDVYLERNGFTFFAAADASRANGILGGTFGPAGGGTFPLSRDDAFSRSFSQRFDSGEEGNALFPNGDYHFDLITA